MLRCPFQWEGTEKRTFPEGQASTATRRVCGHNLSSVEQGRKNIYTTIAEHISRLDPEPTASKAIQEFAAKHPSLKFITTNYDLLIEKILGDKCTTLSPGFPINRQRTHNEIYHIHGSVLQPEHMIVTADDYYEFINVPNYYSKRLEILLEENTTVIIGYSLGDINFKSILNAHRHSSDHPTNRPHLFFLSHTDVPQHVKDYYDTSYGLRVIEKEDITYFLARIEAKYNTILPEVKEAKAQLQRVLSGEKTLFRRLSKKTGIIRKNSYYHFIHRFPCRTS